MLLASQRQLFSIPREVCYLNCAYLSPSTKTVVEAGRQAVAAKEQPWLAGPQGFFEQSERTRALFAQLIGAEASGVAFIPAVSYGMGIVARNVPLSKGQNIVVLSGQFPSNVYPWRELARDKGAELITVARGAGWAWTEPLLAAINSETALIAVPNCHWTDGSYVDLNQLCERAQSVGAAVVVDATQSLGAYPLDVRRTPVDFVVAAGYKWLLGPYSLGFFYAAPKWHAGRPLEFNWLNRKDSEDFARLVDYRDEYQAGARRFDVGERSNFALMPMAEAALQQIIEWRPERIAHTLAKMTAEIEERARGIGLTPVPASERCPHMLGLQLPKDLDTDLPQKLAQAQVYVSVRGDAIRVAPHLYNDAEDIERFFAVLAEVLGRSH